MTQTYQGSVGHDDTALVAAFGFDVADRAALLAAAAAVRAGDPDVFETAMVGLGRCPLDPRGGAELAEPFVLSAWWTSVAVASVLDCVYEQSWQSAEGTAELAALVLDGYPSWTCGSRAVEALLSALLAGVEGRSPAPAAGVSMRDVTAAAVVVLAWCAAVHDIDLVAAFS